MLPEHMNMIDLCCDLLVSQVDMHLLIPELLVYGIFADKASEMKKWQKTLDEIGTKKEIIQAIKTYPSWAYCTLITCLRVCKYPALATYLENRIRRESDDGKRYIPISLRTENNQLTPADGAQREGNKVEVKNAEVLKFRLHPEDEEMTYPMDGEPRGMVLLITVKEYDYEEERHGAECDTEQLDTLFVQMGYRVRRTPYRLTAKQIKSEVEKFSKNRQLRNASACFVIISAHGNRLDKTGEIICGSDNKPRKSVVTTQTTPEVKELECIPEQENETVYEQETGSVSKQGNETIAEQVTATVPEEETETSSETKESDSNFENDARPNTPSEEQTSIDYSEEGTVAISELLEFFSSDKCPLMRGKPKIFIFQTCRGGSEQYFIPHHETSMISRDGRPYEDASSNPRIEKSRRLADILIAHSTVRDHKSYRHKKEGSIFIQTLCQVFMEWGELLPIQDLFNVIDRRIGARRDKICQTTSIEYIGFNKHMYLTTTNPFKKT